jgi:hypothetical protein
MSKRPVIALRSNVLPAGLLQLFDDLADLERLAPMPGAGLTVISPSPFWSADPSILDVRGEDTDTARGHHGYLKIDPGCLTARRTVDYDVQYERSGQQIEFSDDYQTLHVSPDNPDYGQHVLREQKGSYY